MRLLAPLYASGYQRMYGHMRVCSPHCFRVSSKVAMGKLKYLYLFQGFIDNLILYCYFAFTLRITTA